jgi:hypothetical protein
VNWLNFFIFPLELLRSSAREFFGIIAVKQQIKSSSKMKGQQNILETGGEADEDTVL